MADDRWYFRNELLEAAIEQEFDGDRSGLVCFIAWLERQISDGPSWNNIVSPHKVTLHRIRATYADWLAVQAGGMK